MIEDPIEFWETRHASVNEWQAGGDRALSLSRNRAFYSHRLGLLVGIIDYYFYRSSLRILDAGCGKGWFTGQLVLQGHDVHGVDSSSKAIEICRRHRPGSYTQGRLSDFASAELFDVIYSIDVLFHILDDREWSNSLARLVSLLSVDGLLVVTDDPRAERYLLGDYIVHRSLGEYRSLLEPMGLRLIEQLPYRYAGNQNRFLVFRRLRHAD